MVSDTQSLVSRSNDLVRLFNGYASGCCNFTGSADGKRALLQIVNYATGGRGGSGEVTVWTRQRYRNARLWSVDAAQPATLAPVAAEQSGTEYHMPPMQVYGALEFEV